MDGGTTDVEIGGARLRAAVAGPEGAPAVVLLHGASGNLEDWRISVFDRLAAGHRVVAIDRPGYGRSDPVRRGWRLAEQGEAIARGLARLGIGPAVLVGHSFAGALALDWALRRPEEVAGLVVLSGATMDWGGALDLHYRVTAAPVLGRAVAALAPVVVGERRLARALAGVFAPQPVPPRYAERAGVRLALRPGTFRLNARSLAALRGQILANAPRYGRIGCPVEILHGTEDGVVPARLHAVPLARAIGHARLDLIEGVGHMPHHAVPERVVEAVRRVARR